MQKSQIFCYQILNQYCRFTVLLIKLTTFAQDIADDIFKRKIDRFFSRLYLFTTIIVGKKEKIFRFMIQKRSYSKPTTTCVRMKIEEQLLTISAATTNPVEGGDPTGGNGSTPNPFETSGAAKLYTWDYNEE